MTRRSLQVLTGGVLALALVVMGAGFPAKTVPPKQYAKSVCTAVRTWDTNAQASSTAVQRKSAGLANDFPKLKKVFVAYLATTEKGLKTVNDKLSDAGTPSTPQGTAAAKSLTTGFGKARAAVGHLKDDAQKLPTGNAVKAAAGVKTVTTKLDKALGALNSTFSNLSKHDPKHKLQKAFGATKACQSSGS
jgi:hypothetical protein